MFNILRKKKIRTLLETNKRRHSFIDFASINRVMLLFQYKDLEQLQKISQDLEKEGKTVFLFAYDNHSATVDTKNNLSDIVIINNKDISRLGSISADVLDKFESVQYDTIIDFSTSYEYPLYYLLASNKSQFCIGIRVDENKLYDFSLIKEDEMSLLDTYEQIKNYLNNTRKSSNNL